MNQTQYGASLGGPIVARPHFLLLEYRAAELDQTGLDDHHRQQRRRHQRPAGGHWLPGSLISTGIYPNPVDTTNLLGKVDHQVSPDQFSVRYRLYDVASQQLPRRGRLNAPSGVAGLDNIDQTVAVATR